MPTPRTNLTLMPGTAVSATRADAVTAGVDGAASAIAAGAELHVRVASSRRDRLQTDLESGLSKDVTAVLLTGITRAQDLRDADIELRRQELRLNLTPGQIGLIPGIASANAVASLRELLSAVDRLVSVEIDIEAIATELRAPDPTAATLQGPLLAQVAVAATAVHLPWTVAALGFSAANRSRLATRAYALGAAGIYVRSEAEVAGLNALFART